MKRREFLRNMSMWAIWSLIERKFLIMPWNMLKILENSEKEKNLIKDFLTPGKEIKLSQEKGEKILKKNLVYFKKGDNMVFLS